MSNYGIDHNIIKLNNLEYQAVENPNWDINMMCDGCALQNTRTLCKRARTLQPCSKEEREDEVDIIYKLRVNIKDKS